MSVPLAYSGQTTRHASSLSYGWPWKQVGATGRDDADAGEMDWPVVGTHVVQTVLLPTVVTSPEAATFSK